MCSKSYVNAKMWYVIEGGLTACQFHRLRIEVHLLSLFTKRMND